MPISRQHTLWKVDLSLDKTLQQKKNDGSTKTQSWANAISSKVWTNRGGPSTIRIGEGIPVDDGSEKEKHEKQWINGRACQSIQIVGGCHIDDGIEKAEQNRRHDTGHCTIARLPTKTASSIDFTNNNNWFSVVIQCHVGCIRKSANFTADLGIITWTSSSPSSSSLQNPSSNESDHSHKYFSSSICSQQ